MNISSDSPHTIHSAEFSGVSLYTYVLGNPINLVDPEGLWTGQLGISWSVTYGPINIAGFAGFAADLHGGFATYWGGGEGAAVGAFASGGLSLTGSNASTVCDLSGPFVNASQGAGAGLGYSQDAFFGQTSAGVPIVGYGWTVGPTMGASGSVHGTGTSIYRLR